LCARARSTRAHKMLHVSDILQILGAIAVVVVMIVVVRGRHRGKAVHDLGYARENVCEHLRPALEHLLAQGHAVRRVGQTGRDMPLEVHLVPPFDPQALYADLKLEPPVYVSDRNVLICKDDWCELHPVK
jgi:hypothetical protein